jgi:hypothetical protein
MGIATEITGSQLYLSRSSEIGNASKPGQTTGDRIYLAPVHQDVAEPV